MLKRLDPILVIGTLVSIALTVFLLLAGVETIDGLLIALVSTVITLLVDVLARLGDIEERILRAIALERLLASDEELAIVIRQLVEDYLTAKEWPFELFSRKAHHDLLKCADCLHSLAHGRTTVKPASSFAMGRRAAEMAENSLKAVSAEPLELWRTKNWQRGLRANADAVARGVQVIRVFVQDEETLSQFSDVLHDHLQADVEVFVVSPDELAANLVEGFLVVDDWLSVVFHMSSDGRLTAETVAIDPVGVEEAIDRFTVILRNARRYT